MDWLQTIACFLSNIGLAFEWAGVQLINLVIAAFGAFIAALVALLPSMPTTPDAPTSGILGWLNWFVPLDPLLASFAVIMALWAAILVIKTALAWAKVL